MPLSIDDYINKRIAQRKAENNHRLLKSPFGAIDFTSNDYLGFASDAGLTERIKKELEHLKSFQGSTGSRLLTGNSVYAGQLENMLAGFHHAESALLFNSGFAANYGLLSALPYRGDTIIYDELVHASMHDGIRNSRAHNVAFLHNSLQDLEAKLKTAQGLKYVVVESLYSMNGDFAPLAEIAGLCEKYSAGLIVDEAHANGLYGKDGCGLANMAAIEDKCLARIYTFGKALGCFGAVVVGNNNLKDFLLNYCRPLIYSTALPDSVLAGIKCSYEMLPLVEDRRDALKKLADVFSGEMDRFKSIKLLGSKSPIQSVVVPGNTEVKLLAEKLQKKGFDVRPILSPTVPAGAERIRICLHSYNTIQEVKDLAEAFTQ